MLCTTLWAVRPSHSSGTDPRGKFPANILSTYVSILDELQRRLVPSELVMGLSVFSLSVKQGIPR